MSHYYRAFVWTVNDWLCFRPAIWFVTPRCITPSGSTRSTSFSTSWASRASTPTFPEVSVIGLYIWVRLPDSIIRRNDFFDILLCFSGRAWRILWQHCIRLTLKHEKGDEGWSNIFNFIESIFNFPTFCFSTKFSACLRGNLRLTMYLVEKRADVNLKDDEHHTALHLSCQVLLMLLKLLVLLLLLLLLFWKEGMSTTRHCIYLAKYCCCCCKVLLLWLWWYGIMKELPSITCISPARCCFCCCSSYCCLNHTAFSYLISLLWNLFKP